MKSPQVLDWEEVKLISDSEGKFSIEGLKQRGIRLQETKAPEGSLPKNEAAYTEFTVDDDPKTSDETTIDNQPKGILPQLGYGDHRFIFGRYCFSWRNSDLLQNAIKKQKLKLLETKIITINKRQIQMGRKVVTEVVALGIKSNVCNNVRNHFHKIYLNTRN